MADMLSKNENLDRELYTKKELLKTVEDQHKTYIRKIRDEY